MHKTIKNSSLLARVRLTQTTTVRTQPQPGTATRSYHPLPSTPPPPTPAPPITTHTALTLTRPSSSSSSSLSPSPSSTPPRKPLFTKLLIANRGEIALRIIRTCRKLGILTVAVYSSVDAHAQHVLAADESYLLGPPTASESYLNIDKVIDVARRCGAQAIHPGYGFLSENTEFERRCRESGIKFVGPGERAIRSMGSKSESKDIMLSAGVPCVPGFHPTSTSPPNHQSTSFLLKEAKKIGFPVLIKAVSGGGGKGMKIVRHESEFEGLLDSAKREASKSFGDDTVLLEKYLETPRHVEVQIFSSPAPHNQHLSLFERDCSVQRRHQKIIEEAPAPGLGDELRERLYETARMAARAVGYEGAGTVEFIMDAQDPNKFFFMEMNTRLQVEHPITEEITGVDLVEWQIEVAAGNRIPLEQHEIKRNGHAFECRIYAENPRNNFLPATGHLSHVRLPSPPARMETGFGTGDTISVYYDPLIAKLVVHGSDRTEALRILRRALSEYQVVGLETNIEFLKSLAKHPKFVEGQVETGFIPKYHSELFAPPPSPSPSILAQTAQFLAKRSVSTAASLGTSTPWNDPKLAGYRIGGSESSSFGHSYSFIPPSYQTGTTTTPGEEAPPEPVTVTVGPAPHFHTSATEVIEGARADVVPHLVDDGFGGKEERLTIFAGEWSGELRQSLPKWVIDKRGQKKGVKGSARAPMPSRIVQVFVKEGDKVEEGAPLVMVEAMKTEHVLRAPKDGVVKDVIASVGELVPEGKVLVEFVEEEEAASE